jgi:DNA (cytosine-5)-methyltransferase 1
MKGNLNELALFAGAGGGILGGKLLGWRTVCAVEWESYPASVLCARQNEGLLPTFPIWDDVQTFDGKPWAGIVDVISGGFPCQDISAAGKGAGIDGDRSGMWGEMARIIHEVRPRYVFVENSPMLTSRGLGRVLGDLASMGFDARWGVLGAANVGANHQRDRIWIVGTNVAHPLCNRSQRSWQDRDSAGQIGLCGREGCNEEQDLHMAHAQDEGYVRWIGSMGATESQHIDRGSQSNGGGEWWQVEPNVGRVVDGLASRVDRLKAIGNGQVPLCAATAWRILNA